MSRSYQKNLEDLVTSYASVGRQQKRKRKSTVALVTLAGFGLLGLAIILWQFGGTLLTSQRSELNDQAREIRAIKESLAAEIAEIRSQRREFETSRAMLLDQSRLIEQEIDQAGDQREILEAQRVEREQEQTKMASMIAELDRRNDQARRQRDELAEQDPLVERERAAMNQERRKLEQRRQEFAQEGALLEKEIAAINAQRTALAAQRQEVEQRREELQQLLDQSRDIKNTDSELPSSDQRLDPVRAEPEAELDIDTDAEVIARIDATAEKSIGIGLPIIEEYQLDKMRAGFSVGDDMVISVGITRTGAINGVEQFSNTLQITDIATGLSASELAGVTSTIVQNGAGNFISPDVLASISGNFSTVVQNSLDDQQIATTDIYDISVDNVSTAIDNIAAGHAIDNSLLLGQ